MFRDPVKRLVWLYTGFQFFFTLLLWVPIFYEYQRRVGLSDPEIFSIQSVYYLAFCLFEVPTGVLADRIGRLRCVRAGAGLLVLANLLPVFWTTFAGFVWHFLAVALARSLVSGAGSAYLYDALAELGAAGEYRKAEGNARALSLWGKVAVWPVVGLLMEWRLGAPYFLTALASVVAVFVAAAFPVQDESVAAKRGSVSALFGSAMAAWKPAVALVLGSRSLMLVIIQGVAIFVLSRVCQVNLFQPLLNQRGVSVASFGLWMSVITVFEALGSHFPMARSGSEWKAVTVFTLIMAASMVLMALPGQIPVMAGLIILSWATGAAFPVQRQLMNAAIADSSVRATVLSLESIVDRAASAAVVGVLGGIVARGWLSELLVGAALVTILVMAILSSFARKANAS